MPLPALARRADERVIAGVCAGIAQALAVDVTLVRLIFMLLALAGGAGILLYLALWTYSRSRVRCWSALLVVGTGVLLLHAVGSLEPLGRRGRPRSPSASRSHGGVAAFRADAPLSWIGLAIAACGAVLLFEGGRPAGRCSLRAPSPARCS